MEARSPGTIDQRIAFRLIEKPYCSLEALTGGAHISCKAELPSGRNGLYWQKQTESPDYWFRGRTRSARRFVLRRILGYAVGVNPITTDIAPSAFAITGVALFEQPEVHLVDDEGRSFVLRSNELYDDGGNGPSRYMNLATDDKPFFNQTHRWGLHTLRFRGYLGGGFYAARNAQSTFVVLLIQSSIVSGAMIQLPLLRINRSALRAKDCWTLLVYFASLGWGIFPSKSFSDNGFNRSLVPRSYVFGSPCGIAHIH